MDLSTINRIHRKGELDRAEKLYLDYLKAHPDCAMAHALLGTLNLQKTGWGVALEYSSKALELGSDIDECYADMIVACRRLGRLDEAVDIGYRAIANCGERWDRLLGKGKLSKEVATVAGNTLNNMGATLLEMARYKDAETVLMRALTYNKDHADANWNLGIVRLTQGRWDGWHGYEYGFRVGERKVRPYFDEIENWSGQELKGKTILVWGEQGLGDEILFAQCLTDLKRVASKVIVDCHPRLSGLFQRSFKGIQFYGYRKDMTPGLFDGQRIDYQTPIGSLPLWFRTADDQFTKGAYLKARPKEVRKFRDAAPGFRIGLAWRGGSNKTGQRKRSMSLETLLSVLDVKPSSLMDDVSLVALQYGDGVFEDIDAVRRSMGVEIACHDAAIEDFERQADLTASCDLVISVVQTSVHLAGALNVPTMCLVPFGPPWKFTPGRQNIWHSSVTQYHQEKQYEWGAPLVEVRNDLEALLQSRKQESAA